MIKQILILADSCVCQTHKSNKKSFSAKGFHPFFSPTKKKNAYQAIPDVKRINQEVIPSAEIHVSLRGDTGFPPQRETCPIAERITFLRTRLKVFPNHKKIRTRACDSCPYIISEICFNLRLAA